MIEAATVAAFLTPIGVKVKSESQLRPLVSLTPKKIPEAWKKAQQLAGDGEVTAKVVRQAAEEFKTEATPRKAKTPPTKQSNLSRGVLKSALKLVDKAEKALKGNDTKALCSLISKLRECLLD